MDECLDSSFVYTFMYNIPSTPHPPTRNSFRVREFRKPDQEPPHPNAQIPASLIYFQDRFRDIFCSLART